MKRSTKLVAVVATAFYFGAVDSASAGWNNVFQTTCHCRKQTSSSFFAPAPAACPTVTYKQRVFYQPVTTYKREFYNETVTTYRTSYHWEPVTTYRYTSYYDPCTGCCQQVATPRTSFRLRSQCNPVQSCVQRCRLVPVTEMRASYYLEPVVACAPACPPPCSDPSPAPAINESGPDGSPQRMPQINEGVSSDGGSNLLPRTNIGGQQSRSKAAPPQPKPPVKSRPDRVASFDKNSGHIQGAVVFDDRITPRGNAKILFVSVEKNGPQESLQTDELGRFSTNLATGDWLMYVPNKDGKPEFHTRLTVLPADDRLVTVVSR
jgi:hypothetical protein